MRPTNIQAAVTLFCVAAVSVLPGTPAHADSIRDRQWHLRSLRVAEAHRITEGRGIVVAVVDSGVDPHPDLRTNLLRGTDVMKRKDHNGRLDINGHGTKMAGLIAAAGKGNGNGVLGMAPAAKILPVKFEDFNNNDKRNGTIEDGIKWAAAHGANIINVSAVTAPSFDMDDAIKYAADADAVVVAGSGNKPDQVTPAYPASMPGVLAVGASDRSGKHASFSVSGPNVQICAPGVDIMSTKLKGNYSIGSGTSDATAIVSGAAALVRAKFPDLSAPEVIHRLTATATDTGKPGRDDECGYGVLNVVKALTADVPPLPPSSGPTPSVSAASPSTVAAPGASAAADTSPASSNTPLIVGGGIAALIAIAGLLGLLLARRRRTSP